MTWPFIATNAVAQATVWLAVIWLAVWLVRKDSPKSSGPWRSLLLRIGLAGLPVILLLGSIEHILPYARPLWRVAPAAEAETRGRGDTGTRQQDAGTPGRRDAGTKEESPAAVVTLSQHPGVAASSSVPASPRPSVPASDSVPQLPSLPVMMWRFLAIFGPPALGLVWFIGAAFCLARLGVALVRLRLRRRRWNCVQNEAIRNLAAQVAGRVGLRRPFRLLACDDLATPVATGIFQPAVVLPRKQFGYLLTAQGRAVLAHELAHLRSADPVWQIAGAVLRCLLWFHPLIAWLADRLEIEAEFRCDQLALAAGVDRRRYARLLVDLAERAWSNLPLARAGATTVAAVRGSSHLERRLTRILARPTGQPSTMSRPSRWAMLGLSGLLVLSISSVALLGESRQAENETADLAPPTFAPPADRLAQATLHVPTSMLLPPPPGAAKGRGEGISAPPNVGKVLGKPTTAPEAPADRVVVTLADGRHVEGLWLGPTPAGARLRLPDGDKEIPLGELVDIRLTHPSNSPAVSSASPPAGPQQGQQGQAGQPRPADAVADAQRNHLRKLAAEAEESFKAGQLDQAAAKLEEVRKLAPNSVLQMRMLARLYRQLGRPDKADPIEKSLPPLDPPRLTAEQAEEALALVTRLAGEEARFVELRNFDPDDVTHQAQRRKMLAQAGRNVQSAREAIDQWKRKNNRPGDSQSLVRDLARRAEDLLAGRKADLAVSLLNSLREVAPQNVPMLRALARAYDRTGQRDQADEVRRILSELTTSRPTDGRADMGHPLPPPTIGLPPKGPAAHS